MMEIKDGLVLELKWSKFLIIIRENYKLLEDEVNEYFLYWYKCNGEGKVCEFTYNKKNIIIHIKYGK